ncbi:MAG TPA: nitrilase-related carbon-nitrogen hydrolase [Thermovirgaceae bacterium]|jgi:predicted amidohydrolase|nr:nitrilase-related carbon-nitrogen hydrolase [Thermovirgaceae bacterium]
MKKIRVHIIQSDITWGNPAANIKKMSETFNGLPDGPSVVVMPELWTCSYDNPSLQYHSEQSPRALDMLQGVARNKGLYIVAGSLPWKDQPDGPIYNRCYVIGDGGEVTGFYDKAHLFPLLDEPLFFRPGERPFLFEIYGVTASVAICFDIRFPEFVRSIALSGAQMIFVPAEWPSTRIDHWITLLRARAIENQVFIVACNRCGKGGNEIYGGNSLLAAPDGNIVFQAPGSGECVNTIDTDISNLERIRKKFPFTAGRNPRLYTPVTSMGEAEKQE